MYRSGNPIVHRPIEEIKEHKKASGVVAVSFLLFHGLAPFLPLLAAAMGTKALYDRKQEQTPVTKIAWEDKGCKADSIGRSADPAVAKAADMQMVSEAGSTVAAGKPRQRSMMDRMSRDLLMSS